MTSELHQSNGLDGIKIRRKKFKRHCNPTVDRISNLPWDTLDRILYLLPIRDAVRTSILSRSWRYKWANLSRLVFDDNCLGNYCINDGFLGDRLANFVYRVLLSHSGQVDEFTLSFVNCPIFSDLDHWIGFVTKNSIRRLTLGLGAHAEFAYKLPSCIFSCQQLTHLQITNCLLELPVIFECFSSLLSLHLQGFAMENTELERLIRNCPILESLTLTQFDHIPCFNIHAPNLKYLYLDGDYDYICLENCPLLANISFKMTSDLLRGEPEVFDNLIRALASLCGLQRLTLSNDFLSFLGMSNGPETLHVYNHLNILELSMTSFCGDHEFTGVLSLLIGAPNLQQLYFSVVDDQMCCSEPSELRQAQLQSNCCFNSLRICVLGFSRQKKHILHWKSELEFIKFLLSCSPILEKMKIKINGIIALDGPGVKFDKLFMGKLMGFQRAAAQVKITYLS